VATREDNTVTERAETYTVSPGIAPGAVAVVPPTEGLPIWCGVAPGPREYRLALVDDLGPLLPREEATFSYPERVDAACLAPERVAGRLYELAAFAELCRQHPEIVTPGSGLRLLRDRLEDLAWRVVPA